MYNHRQFFIPRGFADSFSMLSDVAISHNDGISKTLLALKHFNMIDITDKFFQILRCAIHDDLDVPQLSVNEWKQIYGIAQKQSLLAVVFRALERATPPADDNKYQFYI